MDWRSRVGQKTEEKVLTRMNLYCQNDRMKILITGHRGYIGLHPVKLFKEAGTPPWRG
jgi:hypothetical protein